MRVGRSASGSKTVGADVTECPHRVDKSNWHGGHAHQDTFEVYVWRTGAVTARRIDACGGCAWGMDLEFLCRRCPERPLALDAGAARFRDNAKPCLGTMQ